MSNTRLGKINSGTAIKIKNFLKAVVDIQSFNRHGSSVVVASYNKGFTKQTDCKTKDISSL